MVFCYSCGNEETADKNFCSKCGTKLVNTVTDEKVEKIIDVIPQVMETGLFPHKYGLFFTDKRIIRVERPRSTWVLHDGYKSIAGSRDRVDELLELNEDEVLKEIQNDFSIYYDKLITIEMKNFPLSVIHRSAKIRIVTSNQTYSYFLFLIGGNFNDYVELIRNIMPEKVVVK